MHWPELCHPAASLRRAAASVHAVAGVVVAAAVAVAVSLALAALTDVAVALAVTGSGSGTGTVSGTVAVTEVVELSVAFVILAASAVAALKLLWCCTFVVCPERASVASC